jgi:hypothetical protein
MIGTVSRMWGISTGMVKSLRSANVAKLCSRSYYYFQISAPVCPDRYLYVGTLKQRNMERGFTPYTLGGTKYCTDNGLSTVGRSVVSMYSVLLILKQL